MAKPGVAPRDLPMEPLSYILTNGDYHPPLAGFLLLALAAALIAAQATGARGLPEKPQPRPAGGDGAPCA